ncbi:MAG: assimilatory sulfite reductase (NADPH) flavoprotein subunit [Verrucomicrobiota bacterium]
MQLPDYAPFDPAQRQALASLLATMTPQQASWLSGFVAGAQTAGQGAAAAPAPASAPAPAAKRELTVLFGTESGNSEALADQTAKLGKKNGFKVKTRNMSETKAQDLAAVENLLVVVSTWGDGDPPEAAIGFYEDLMGEQAPALDGLHFSVCALGDTAYEQFCETGKRIDERLEKLGGQRVHARQDCDVEYEEPWKAWVQPALDGFPQTAAPSQSVPAPTTSSTFVVEAAPLAPPPAPVYDKKNPWPAELLEKVNLNGTGSAKETWHYEFSLEDSGLRYEPGDALAVLPENRPEDVEDLLIAGKFESGLAADLRTKYDITNLSQSLVSKYNELAGSSKLSRLLDPKKKDELKSWLHGRQIIDLLQEFPIAGLTGKQFTGLLRKLQPRLYSIASSLKAHEDEVHLTVASVRYTTHGRDRVGVASTYLADRVQSGDRVPVYFHQNKNFRLPENPETPIIMVGPGTGIAPFRAFMEERVATKASGQNWLFFGDQRYSYDFLYQLEWQEYFAEGQLHKLSTAFSRDQKHKIYVQDRMKEEAAELYRWLEEGAYFYVCGDASRMAKDVHQTLLGIIESQGGHTRNEAEAYLKALRQEKRYQRDVY